MKELQFLIKPASSACNLRCRYCFYTDIAQNRSVSNMGMMQPETVRRMLQEAFTQIEPGGSVHFAFRGGEPAAAGLQFFQDFSAQATVLKPKNISDEGIIVHSGKRTVKILILRTSLMFYKSNLIETKNMCPGGSGTHFIWTVVRVSSTST